MSSNARVLLIDDEPAHRLLEKRSLRRALPHVHIVEFDSIEVAQQSVVDGTSSFQLAVIDLNVAGESGLSAVRLLRSIPAYERTPIVLISTSQLDHDVHSSYVAGANCYIFKSDDPDTFDQHLFAAVQFLTERPR